MHQSGRLRDHVVDAVVAPDGIHFTWWSIASSAASRSVCVPARAVRPTDHRFAIQPDEPLRRRQEDHRVVAAPAVRVLVRERLAMPEPAALLQRLLDLRVRVEHALPPNSSTVSRKCPRRSDRRVDLEPVLHAGVEVVGAVAGRRVHRAGAGVERHVVAEHAERVARVERMPEADALELRRPSSARPARRTCVPTAAATFGASASATITARPSTSYAA